MLRLNPGAFESLQLAQRTRIINAIKEKYTELQLAAGVPMTQAEANALTQPLQDLGHVFVYTAAAGEGLDRAARAGGGTTGTGPGSQVVAGAETAPSGEAEVMNDNEMMSFTKGLRCRSTFYATLLYGRTGITAEVRLELANDPARDGRCMVRVYDPANENYPFSWPLSKPDTYVKSVRFGQELGHDALDLAALFPREEVDAFDPLTWTRHLASRHTKPAEFHQFLIRIASDLHIPNTVGIWTALREVRLPRLEHYAEHVFASEMLSMALELPLEQGKMGNTQRRFIDAPLLRLTHLFMLAKVTDVGRKAFEAQNLKPGPELARAVRATLKDHAK